MAKRTTEAVLRDELAKTARELATAITKRNEAEERAKAARIAADGRKAAVAEAIEMRDRARRALESIIGRPLKDDELVAAGLREPTTEPAP